MKILFDTHAFLWWTASPEKLPESLLQQIEDHENELYLSVVSSWEVEIKLGIGKLRLHDDWENIVRMELEKNDFRILPVHLHHSYALKGLEPLHKDPFDRMLIAQACSEKMVLASCDSLVRQYKDVPLIWD